MPGQGLVLHDSANLSSPSQSFPPFLATTSFGLVQFFWPPPQVVLHSSQTTSPQTQSTKNDNEGFDNVIQNLWFR